jgi:hypothetical protein
MLPAPNVPDHSLLTLLVGAVAPSLPLRRQGVMKSVMGNRSQKHIQLTPRDLAILRDLTRFYGLTAEQVAQRHFGALRTGANRLSDLCLAGVVELHRVWYRGPGVYVVTNAGARAADVGLPAPRYKPLAMVHHLAVADIADYLLRKYAHVEGIAWVCEREVRQSSMAIVRSRHGGRVLAGVAHVPDGVLTTPSSAWAVEVELTRKTDSAYGRILRWYAAQDQYRRVVWYVASEAVARRLAALIQRERLDDLMVVQPLPNTVQVRSWG